MTEQRVSYRYARALLDTASQEGLVDTVYEDLDMVGQMLHGSRELKSLVASPIIQYWRKKKVMREVFEENIEPLTLNFILLLTEKRRENLIPSIIEEFIKLYNELKNKLPVEIATAVEIPDSLKDKVVRQLEDMTKKEVLPNFTIDSSLKGGITVKINDWVYDASVRNQLRQLYTRLVEGR